MKSKAPPKPAALTEEETLRDARVLSNLKKATGGYSVTTVANFSHCSDAQARASLARLCAKDPAEIEQYASFGNSTLYRVKRDPLPSLRSQPAKS